VRALITGADGQLARELISSAPPEVQLRSFSRAECDITELPTVERIFKSFRPNVVINTAAYTAVDAAEENEGLAFRINAGGAENVAKAAELIGSRLIHISTDYVFDGRRTTPYPSDAPTNPVNVYGASKLEGERLAMAAAPSAVIVRAGWLYSTTGKNFLVKILTALRNSQPLSVVSDLEGCPTSAREFASAIWKTAGAGVRGVYHWANSGSCSWYGFACEIGQIAKQLGLLRGEPVISPVMTTEYATRANRPRYSVLDPTVLATVLQMSPTPWREALRRDISRRSVVVVPDLVGQVEKMPPTH
jgi:dTDP-4-dehydrorhamnose reductase